MSVDFIYFKFADAKPAGFVLYSSSDSQRTQHSLGWRESVPLPLSLVGTEQWNDQRMTSFLNGRRNRRGIADFLIVSKD